MATETGGRWFCAFKVSYSLMLFVKRLFDVTCTCQISFSSDKAVV